MLHMRQQDAVNVKITHQRRLIVRLLPFIHAAIQDIQSRIGIR